MSRRRSLICRIRRKKQWLRKYLDRATFTDLDYKGNRVTLVKVPPRELPAAVVEAKALIDGIDKERGRKNE
ncbi:MAG: hypothetical protein IJI41_14050 [Anaerolineaceae bacterium]|nr:hypothetical protein [Anaerolineaceae bacterium]